VQSTAFFTTLAGTGFQGWEGCLTYAAAPDTHSKAAPEETACGITPASHSLLT